MIEFHEDVSWRVLARLFSEGRKFDFAFIDGCHNYDAVFIDFWFASRMMNAGGIIVLDDVKFPSVRKVCRYVLRHMPFRVIDAAGQPDPHRSWKWECLDMVKAIIPNLSQQIFKPEILRPDLEISRYFSCIALLKEADTWDYEKFCDF
ncbi:MAG: hypothetical protein A3C36_02930 [Omnitrophica WOR_2 bacterium RIFCSPHIGHO2_02_FULL_52_10]|nr:MAG: hypothetical protein A3C36_02930 [Omnitrophica WOR_2 bacterium RIFCSPHIGHO2_02_FULL_52_10]